MTRGLRGFLFQICGHCGDKGQCWRLWLQPFITLISERAQLPLPMAARVPKRIPNADSFVGIPFMRPTLRMHWPSRLQRHTNTGVGNEDESVREASQLLGTSCLENCPRDVFVCAGMCERRGILLCICGRIYADISSQLQIRKCVGLCCLREHV